MYMGHACMRQGSCSLHDPPCVQQDSDQLVPSKQWDTRTAARPPCPCWLLAHQSNRRITLRSAKTTQAHETGGRGSNISHWGGTHHTKEVQGQQACPVHNLAVPGLQVPAYNCSASHELARPQACTLLSSAAFLSPTCSLLSAPCCLWGMLSAAAIVPCSTHRHSRLSCLSNCISPMTCCRSLALHEGHGHSAACDRKSL